MTLTPENLLRASGLWPTVEGTAARYHVPPARILARDRHKQVAAARGELCAILRLEHGFSYPEVGRLIGRDHTTVMQAVRAHAARAAEARAEAAE